MQSNLSQSLILYVYILYDTNAYLYFHLNNGKTVFKIDGEIVFYVEGIVGRRVILQ